MKKVCIMILVGVFICLYAQFSVSANVFETEPTDTENTPITQLPTEVEVFLDDKEAKCLLGFIYNTSIEDVDFSDNLFYQLLTGKLPEDVDVSEVKTAFLTFVEMQINSQIEEASGKCNMITADLTTYLEGKLKSMTGATETECNDAINECMEKITDRFIGGLDSKLARKAGIFVSEEMVENLQIAASSYFKIIELPSKVQEYVEYLYYGTKSAFLPFHQEYAGRYTYFSLYMYYHGTYEEEIADAAMDMNLFSIKNNYPLGTLDWYWGSKESWVDHIDDIERWAEAVLEVKGSLVGERVFPTITGSCGENVQWTLDSTATLTINCEGRMTDFEEGKTPWEYFKVVVMELIVQEGVTHIGSYALSECNNLVDVSIADSVRSIGKCAFSECGDIVEMDIPDNVELIGERAFHACAKLENLTLSKNLKHIGDGAFWTCPSLKNVYIPYGVKSVGSRAFQACGMLQSVVLPYELEKIGEYAFAYCNNLISVDVPYGVGEISDYAFAYCYNLQSASLPPTVKKVGNYAFYSCSSLQNIMFPYKMEEMGDYAFAGCEALMEIMIPESVTKLGKYAFSGCVNLTNAYISDSVTVIEEGIFQGCMNLKSLIIPESILKIGDGAFSYCSSLRDVTIPEEVTSIGKNAVYMTAYYNDYSNWKNDALYINNHLISVKNTVTGEYIIDQNTVTIADYAFEGCNGLTNITIPDSVTNIGKSAFDAAYSITDINYKGSEEDWNTIEIDDSNNTYLQNVTIHYNYTDKVEIAADVENSVVTIAVKGISENNVVYALVIEDGIAKTMAIDLSKGQRDLELSENAAGVKIFVWESCESMKPLCEAKMIKISK